MKTVLGIDLGGTNLRMGLVDKNGSITAFEKVSSKFISDENGLNKFEFLIKEYLRRNSKIDDDIVISIGVPSVVSRDKSYIYSTPNLKGIENMDLGNVLTNHLGMEVIVDRDVDNLLLNDIRINKLDVNRNKTIIGVYVGTGLGNAIYINGKIFNGKNGAAGELGHIPLFGVDDCCTCGKKGCAETRASGRYLEKIAEQYFPETLIKKIFVEKGNTEVIKQFINNLAIPIATEINILDPDFVVLAGGVLGMEKFPKKLLINKINMNLRTPYPLHNIEYIFPEFSQMNGVLGSACSVFNR